MSNLESKWLMAQEVAKYFGCSMLGTCLCAGFCQLKRAGACNLIFVGCKKQRQVLLRKRVADFLEALTVCLRQASLL